MTSEVKQIFALIFGVILLIVVAGLFSQGKLSFLNKYLKPTTISTPTPKASNLKTLKIGDKEIQIKIARSNEERKKGLSGVTNLPENEGLLFIPDVKNVKPSFWMKDMLISIDIIWINDDKVIQVDASLPVPPKTTPDSKLDIYAPQTPVDYILEVNAGFSQKNNITVGTKVDLTKAL